MIDVFVDGRQLCAVNRPTERESMLTTNQKAALDRLIAHAKRNTGQAARVANFLLCWWNADEQGKFDVRDIWRLDDAIAADVLVVFSMIATHSNVYPDYLGYEDDFKRIISVHR
jgi:hypothetical protein